MFAGAATNGAIVDGAPPIAEPDVPHADNATASKRPEKQRNADIDKAPLDYLVNVPCAPLGSLPWWERRPAPEFWDTSRPGSLGRYGQLGERFGMSRFVVALFAILVAGCSAAPVMNGLPVTGPSANALKSLMLEHQRHRPKGKAIIRIRIPKAKHRRPVRIHGHYVSAATASIEIVVTPTIGDAQHFDANLTAADDPKHCATQSGAIVCTIPIDLPAGNYTASFATYTGALDHGGNPTGDVLSSNQSVPLNIAAGMANTVPVTLYAVPTAVELVPAPGSSLSGSTKSGFDVARCNDDGVYVEALDAGGETIIGPGAPVPSLSSENDAVLSVATPAPSASPATFVLVKASPSPAPETTVQLDASVTPDAATGSTTPVTASVTLTVDTDPCGAITEYRLAPVGATNTLPWGITAGPDGNMWFTEYQAGYVGKVTSDGTFTTYSLGRASPVDIVVGPDNNLYAGDVYSNIFQITTSGTVTQFPTPSGSSPYGLVVGPDNNIWFADASGSVGNMTTAGVVTEYSGVSAGSFPGWIAVGSDNNLWFTEQDGNRLARVTTGGVVTEFPTLGSSNTWPAGIVSGPDGNLWFGEYHGFTIASATTAAAVTTHPANEELEPYGLVFDKRGNLWFTDQGYSQIVELTTTGNFNFFPLTANSLPNGIALAPDGTLWFTEGANNVVGHLQ